jgi:hypothetical protein
MTLKRETEVIPFLKDIRTVTSKCKPLPVTTVLSIAQIIVKKKFPFSSLGIRIFPHANHLTSAQRASMVYAKEACITQMSIFIRRMIHYQCGNFRPFRRVWQWYRRNKWSAIHLFLNRCPEFHLQHSKHSHSSAPLWINKQIIHHRNSTKSQFQNPLDWPSRSANNVSALKYQIRGIVRAVEMWVILNKITIKLLPWLEITRHAMYA